MAGLNLAKLRLWPLAREMVSLGRSVTATRRYCSSSSDSEDSAVSVDDRLPALEPSNDADSVAKLLLHHHNPFHAMESSLQLYGISLSPDLLNQTLIRLKHSSKVAIAFFHYAKQLPNPSPLTTASYNLLVDIVAKVRQYDVAWQLIVEMENYDLTPTSTTFLILIRRLISSGLTRQAIRAFDDIETFVGTKTTSEDFHFLLDTLCKYGYVRVAAEVFNRRRNGLCPNVKMFTVLIYGWCKIGRIDMAERFMKDMVERGIEPNVVTYNYYYIFFKK